ncbi:Versicolorin reductase [Aspergillus coremiiformis]|uniref:Versicolorin reductase n=1 Tax=Aspergillus coremiiformis TaxID=138285 RepID=A0A5N6YYK9_9EURO|nr:Versicolorin reductase [Aspergillus coremiiformis]
MSVNNKNLEGKVALVTGSGRGIGAAIAIRLAQHGAHVVVNYASSASAAEKVAEQIRSYGVKAIAVKANVSKVEDLTVLFQAVISEFGRLDIVMSNSGVEHFGHLPDVTEAEIDKALAVNVKGQFFVAQQAYKHLADHGRLILTSSISAVQGYPNHAVYSASKAAVQGMTKCLAHDFGPRNITVNCVAPGGVKTDMYADAAAKYFPHGDRMTPEEIEAGIAKASPFNRIGFPEDIAGVIALIASPESQWLTGQTFFAGGGAHMV